MVRDWLSLRIQGTMDAEGQLYCMWINLRVVQESVVHCFQSPFEVSSN